MAILRHFFSLVAATIFLSFTFSEVIEIEIFCESDVTSNICKVKHLTILHPGLTAIRNDSFELYEKDTTAKRTMPPAPTKPRPRTTRRLKNATGTPPTSEAPETTPLGTTTTPDPLIKLWRNKQVLLILHCNTTNLPIELSNVFPHITLIVVWFSGLETFDVTIFRGMRYLTEINFQDNEISSFPESSFERCMLLTTINLGGNKIRNLPEKMLMNNTRLQTFIANRNEIEVLPEKLFMFNPKLTFVNLNNNRIKFIFIDFTKLRSIEKILGLQNDCANFFLTKNFNAVQLNALVKANCSEVKRNSRQPEPSTVSN